MSNSNNRKPQIQSSPEQFQLSRDKSSILRNIQRSDGTYVQTRFVLNKEPKAPTFSQEKLARIADLTFLRSIKPPSSLIEGKPVRIADIYSGCGLMTLGAWEACRALGLEMVPVYALDVNPFATEVYKLNFPMSHVETEKVEEVLGTQCGKKLSSSELFLKKRFGDIDLLVGGPPCQGHSDLNNYTRRNDPKNRLYEKMARFAEVFRPNHIIIENVPAVTHDRGKSMEHTAGQLRKLGYLVDQSFIESSELGVPQKRRRHVLVASFQKKIKIQTSFQQYKRESRSVGWAIRDLLNVKSVNSFDTPSRISPDNQKRIKFLFEQDIYDLPDFQRPDCHRLKKHSYKSVYGRMYWEKPAQTITSGFTSTGQGRFVHPKRRRTLTPHEAARLQFIPDFFKFGENIPRAVLTDLIGNAVPPKLTYVLALDLLR